MAAAAAVVRGGGAELASLVLGAEGGSLVVAAAACVFDVVAVDFGVGEGFTEAGSVVAFDAVELVEVVSFSLDDEEVSVIGGVVIKGSTLVVDVVTAGSAVVCVAVESSDDVIGFAESEVVVMVSSLPSEDEAGGDHEGLSGSLSCGSFCPSPASHSSASLSRTAVSTGR